MFEKKAEIERTKASCVVGTPFEVKHVSHAEFDKSNHAMTVCICYYLWILRK